MLSSIKKKDLYQDMVAFYANLFGLPPLHAKLYVFMMFDVGHRGFTFDELLRQFNVSKSSLSNSLRMLIQHRYIEYISPIDSRKRFYRINSKFLEIRFGDAIEKLKTERGLMIRMLLCNERKKDVNDIVLNAIRQYVNILDKHIGTFEEILREIVNLHNHK